VSKEDARVLSVSHDRDATRDITSYMNPAARQVEAPED
jgi:hypothetical protein